MRGALSQKAAHAEAGDYLTHDRLARVEIVHGIAHAAAHAVDDDPRGYRMPISLKDDSFLDYLLSFLPLASPSDLDSKYNRFKYSRSYDEDFPKESFRPNSGKP